MNKLYRILFFLTLALGLMLSGGLIGWHLAGKPQQTAMPIAAVANTPKVLYWYDPMMPQQHFDHPGKSPFMDMELQPKYAEAEQSTGLSIDAKRTQNIGMRLATVERIALQQQITASGLINFNERDQAILQSRSNGYVLKTWPLANGDIIKAGQPLVELLLPEWVTAQQELLTVRELNDAKLLSSARQRLQLLGMSDELIRQVEQQGKIQAHTIINAPISGVAQDVQIRNGMTVANAQTLLKINGLTKVWLDVAVSEGQLGNLKVGDSARISFSGQQQTIFANISAILPILNENSRSLKIRIELSNADLQLRPGMSAQVSLLSQSPENALAVPTAALIRTGKRSVVMLTDATGHYQPQQVQTGREIDDLTIITAGLSAGQQVVASGQFLIDSEASLSGVGVSPLPIQEEMP